MDWLLESMVVVALFILRLGIPLAITFVVAYGLRRLDAKWQMEKLEEWQVSQPEEKVTAEARRLQAQKPGLCWSIKGCDERTRAACPACKLTDIPCWLARRRAEGRLPAECYDCSLFSLRKVAETLAS
jgi:hypothetical protein